MVTSSQALVWSAHNLGTAMYPVTRFKMSSDLPNLLRKHKISLLVVENQPTMERKPKHGIDDEIKFICEP